MSDIPKSSDILNAAWKLDRGFLPGRDPASLLPLDFKFLDEFGYELPALISSGKIQQAARSLPIPRLESLDGLDDRDHARAMMLYGFGASAFLHSSNPSGTSLCRELAQPLCFLSNKSRKPPILSYCSYALSNWRRLDGRRGPTLDNIVLSQKFIEEYDEDWFVLVHVAIESEAASLPFLSSRVIESIERSDLKYLEAWLAEILNVIEKMIEVFERMPEKCSPEVYYKRVRPWIKYFENVVYEGVDEFAGLPKSFRGETGAQSSIMPLLDALFNVNHKESVLTKHVKEMKLYMLPAHRDFVELVSATSKLREFVSSSGSRLLKNLYNRCLLKMCEFRQMHLRYAISYIAEKTPDSRGTGGTVFIPWLKNLEKETQDMLLS
ncbi:MAG TPA: hypothetical protein VJH71_01180 [Candidatus Paceibacterota bacterium]